jgi:DNA-binding response OmpR family regulator
MSTPIAIVIEDDKMLGEVYRDVLTMCGFSTQHIIDSQLAMDAIRSSLPTLVMLDLNLSRISGVEILQSIRADESLKNVRVIVATGSSYAVQDETINAFADIVLFKPISIQQIMDFVSRIKTSDTSINPVVDEAATEPTQLALDSDPNRDDTAASEIDSNAL